MCSRRCSVRDCYSGYFGGSKVFFSCNAKYRDCDKWKAFTERDDPPKNCYICEDHFLPEDFINVNCKSQGLRRFVVPSIKPPADSLLMLIRKKCNQTNSVNK
ncbi:uncharacterized protein LOC128093597 isoform X1 [Culex pipiens pallens]|uniref:uncharacterized protein LOC128093597 isoform X1 n=1 Tax=Culex pipiens pallens TaxID=42434 RepID=UPI0022AAFB0F|nr:uncharacterized protein LOC128093597 isoform X1 [Culex pipiens pallens]